MDEWIVNDDHDENLRNFEVDPPFNISRIHYHYFLPVANGRSLAGKIMFEFLYCF